MFKIAKDPQFTHKVPVQVPVDDGFEEQSLRTRFRAIDSDEAGKFDLMSGEGTEAFCRRIVVGFSDVVGDDGQPVDMAAEELKDVLLRQPYVRVALVRAYTAAMHGVRLGN